MPVTGGTGLTGSVPRGEMTAGISRDQNLPSMKSDPTQLTTQSIFREIASLNDLLTTRMVGMDQISVEKFRTVEQAFELVERQRVEQKQDTKAAVDAALTAQKEAVREQTLASERAIAKSEASTTKSLEQMTTTFSTALEGLRRSIDDQKERTASIEKTTTERMGSMEKSLSDRFGSMENANLIRATGLEASLGQRINAIDRTAAEGHGNKQGGKETFQSIYVFVAIIAAMVSIGLGLALALKP